ncbi:MAG: MBL fold metallo-hydrolase [Clostridia bacterium]|nr:MBL fold metallo-hydrolase [Clostridia bacterium]
MAKSKKSNSKTVKLPRWLVILLSILVVVYSAYEYFFVENNFFNGDPLFSANGEGGSTGDGNLNVYYLDVGQADSIYVELPNGQNMLIDAGNNADGTPIVKYLRNTLRVKRIDYVIGTHAHEDHIGGLDTVIKNFTIGSIIMPYLPDKSVPTTKTYEDVLDAIVDKNLTATAAYGGQLLLNDTERQLKIEILSPVKDKYYEEMNDYSIVMRITYKNRSFMFTGDAEKLPEGEMVDAGYDLKADVLKMGHHGSSTSSSEKFVKAVDPTYAVITCGRNNDYGHPHKETLSLISKLKLTTYRTDKQNTIKAACDGDKITFTTGLPVCDGNSDD